LETVAQNDQEAANFLENIPNEHIEQLSADPKSMVSGSLPSKEVQLLAQTTQPAQNVNISTSTMGSTAGFSKFLVSSLPTPNTVSLSPPPITNKTTNKLPNILDLFESLDTFVTRGDPSNKEKVEASDAAPLAKP